MKLRCLPNCAFVEINTERHRVRLSLHASGASTATLFSLLVIIITGSWSYIFGWRE